MASRYRSIEELESWAKAAWESDDWEAYNEFCDELVSLGEDDPRSTECNPDRYPCREGREEHDFDVHSFYGDGSSLYQCLNCEIFMFRGVKYQTAKEAEDAVKAYHSSPAFLKRAGWKPENNPGYCNHCGIIYSECRKARRQGGPCCSKCCHGNQCRHPHSNPSDEYDFYRKRIVANRCTACYPCPMGVTGCAREEIPHGHGGADNCRECGAIMYRVHPHSPGWCSNHTPIDPNAKHDKFQMKMSEEYSRRPKSNPFSDSVCMECRTIRTTLISPGKTDERYLYRPHRRDMPLSSEWHPCSGCGRWVMEYRNLRRPKSNPARRFGAGERRDESADRMSLPGTTTSYLIRLVEKAIYPEHGGYSVGIRYAKACIEELNIRGYSIPDIYNSVYARGAPAMSRVRIEEIFGLEVVLP